MSILPFETQLDSAAIADQAERLLRESPYYYLKMIRCQCESGVLTLRGRVPLVSLREFAESIVSRAPGVERVVNRVEIYDPQRASA
jgi:osmotically-inducible protein OsmY